MKLATSRPTTQTERIFALEQARKGDTDRLDKIEAMVADIHGILVNARGFKWVMDGFFKYAGYIATAAVGGIGIWKFLTGH